MQIKVFMISLADISTSEAEVNAFIRGRYIFILSGNNQTKWGCCERKNVYLQSETQYFAQI